MSCTLAWDSADRCVTTTSSGGKVSHHVNRNACKSPSHWRTTTLNHRELAEYSQHPSSAMGTSISSSILQLTPVNLPLAEATYQDMGKQWGSIIAAGKEQCFPQDRPPSPRLPCLAHTSSRQPAAWLCLSFLAKPWVNKLRVIPSAWGYLQRLARLIVTPGSLPVTVSEGRELVSGPCHVKTGPFLLQTFMHNFKRFSRNTPPSRRKTPFQNLKEKKGKQLVHLSQTLNYAS